jgi:hypothetical protein
MGRAPIGFSSPTLTMLTQKQSPAFVVHYPPTRPTLAIPSVILYGSIDKAVNWQNDMASSLSDLPIAILNPSREDWDSSWDEDISFPKFKEQVEWEMDYAQQADVIAFYYGPATDAPISLLELGMYAGTGKVVVCCHPDYKKKGNVQMVCHRYGIPLVYELDGLKELVRERLEKALGSVSAT